MITLLHHRLRLKQTDLRGPIEVVTGFDSKSNEEKLTDHSCQLRGCRDGWKI